jgi:hypothetical protein
MHFQLVADKPSEQGVGRAITPKEAPEIFSMPSSFVF